MTKNKNLKELIDTYNSQRIAKRVNVSFQIESLYNKYLDTISKTFDISKSFLLRIMTYEFVESYLDTIMNIEELICPVCGTNKIEKTNKGVGVYDGTAIYKCEKGDVFMAKDLSVNRKIDEFFNNKKEVNKNE